MDAFDAAHVTAAILAGGAGSRLGGRDKGLELLRGAPLIAHVRAALDGQAHATLVCINRNADAYGAFGTALADARAGFRGPLAGIAAALRACRTAWLLTVPVDCPQPPHDLANNLFDAAQRGSAPAAVAHDGNRRQPLFALYTRACAAHVDGALARDLPVWRWQDELGALEVDFSASAAAFGNLNTREDFRAWETSHEH